ncbi:DUF58 domain-containing protein [Curtobacterium sp. MCBD17_040]|uniref:DUF58 domain-containing protein n=1 Tax=Curtobacterium sp. MCBD17_040 TaxID=2175674 RepID=UPI000DA9D42D|nr:DUF58 domain-containing protein [Curtobacterium sp. MCBD17_040]WIB64251.1 DUF58 domain-containing protein [Curtobacterium sp. MCBD17_040]
MPGTRRGRVALPRPTSRGWTTVAVGIGLVGAGLVATTSLAVTAGLLVLVLVVLGAVVAMVAAGPIRATRQVPRTTIEAGAVFRATLLVEGRQRALGVVRVLVRDRLDDHFASAGDLEALVDVGSGRPPARLTVEAIAARRGRPRLGPATVRVADPFGLVHVDRVVVAAQEIVVVPRTTVLGAIETGVLSGAVSAEAGRTGQGGSADDSELRPYRPGDPIRRVHWGQSAKRGELHVRQTAQAQPPEATVLLDVRRASYQELGREPFAELSDMAGDAAFEHAVVVAASVARVLAARTSRVALVTADDVQPSPAGDLASVLVGLADVALRSDARPVAEVLPEVRGVDVHGMTAVITGQCTAEQASELVARTPPASRGLLVAITPPDAAARGVLDRAGWRILVVPVGGSVR